MGTLSAFPLHSFMDGMINFRDLFPMHHINKILPGDTDAILKFIKVKFYLVWQILSSEPTGTTTAV